MATSGSRQNKAVKQQELSRDFPEVLEGTAAKTAGLSVDQCPYEIQDQRRIAWMTGWYDEHMRRKLGHIFTKYNMEYP